MMFDYEHEDKVKKRAKDIYTNFFDELEKEAEKYVPNINWHAYSSKEIREAMMLYYRKGAEPREKRITELAMQLEDTEKELADYHIKYLFFKKLSKENAELKETLTVGTTWNKHLNSRNKFLEEESGKYRNMAFDKMEQLDRAKEIIRELLDTQSQLDPYRDVFKERILKAEQFLKEVDK